MESFVNRRQKRSSSLNSNPQWIENVLLKLHATERIQDSVEESFGLVRAVVNILLSAVKLQTTTRGFRFILLIRRVSSSPKLPTILNCSFSSVHVVFDLETFVFKEIWHARDLQ